MTKTRILGVVAFLFILGGLGTGLQAAEKKSSAPAVYKVKFETSKGNFVIEVHRDWAPLGADRIHELVQAKFFDDVRFFRVVKGFVVQFGISGNPKISKKWESKNIKDDPVKESNKEGYVTFAKTGRPDSRTTQLFINFKNNSFLDGMGFAPVGKVVSGMDVVNQLNGEYEDRPTEKQPEITTQGNAYLKKEFPNLDYVKKARIEK